MATNHHDLEGGPKLPSHPMEAEAEKVQTQPPILGSRDSSHSFSRSKEDPIEAEGVLDERVLQSQPTWCRRLLGFLARYKLELQGIEPVPLALRQDRKWFKVVGLWFSASFNLLLLSTGSIVPFYAISHKAALIAIPLWVALFSLIPAYICTFGPLTGLRTMVFTRYTFGKYGTILICILNAATGIGYSILNAITGGQTLSAVSPNGSLTPTVGIVIICLISLAISFMGIRILAPVEMWVWVPIMICFIILTAFSGTGPDGLHLVASDPANPTTARGVLGIGALVAGLVVTYASISMDYSLALKPDLNRTLFGCLCWLSFLLSIAMPLMLGASITYCAQDIPAWSEALETSFGTLVNLIYSSHAGNFGRFLTFLLSLSVLSNLTPTFYSFGLTLQTGLPFRGISNIPRPAWPILAFALTLPLAIVGATAFSATLTNFLALIGYWAAFYTGVILFDHVLLRRRNYASYDPEAWNDWGRLPWGAAAVTACICSLAVIIPSVDQLYFTGPIALKVGDLGFELGFILTGVVYIPLRLLERHVSGR
ncbi:unnamed protein product [Tilletia controversa]|uniref:Purine-cytosine permease n=1 Tax=Tilletia controversa TaxID=13291 RepID=A0A8X7MXE2_9BASI|nr:hypothetical protein CF328_g1558 [Tilletia controversa]KAE8252851.1 hypothetical protein A4X06_0g1880 [Tilletia controversa]CAD6909169.1 unnamed protein product [Tilletia controversa]CAD6916733.1 unnamed protein product [Tilletia controversa]CAD6968297.1 unnamed protein product [Tilletia controversa]